MDLDHFELVLNYTTMYATFQQLSPSGTASSDRRAQLLFVFYMSPDHKSSMQTTHMASSTDAEANAISLVAPDCVDVGPAGP